MKAVVPSAASSRRVAAPRNKPQTPLPASAPYLSGDELARPANSFACTLIGVPSDWGSDSTAESGSCSSLEHQVLIMLSRPRRAASAQNVSARARARDSPCGNEITLNSPVSTAAMGSSCAEGNIPSGASGVAFGGVVLLSRGEAGEWGLDVGAAGCGDEYASRVATRSGTQRAMRTGMMIEQHAVRILRTPGAMVGDGCRCGYVGDRMGVHSS